MRQIKQRGAGHVELDVERRYVALKQIRFGDGWLQPGDPVPIEPGRDYGRMVQHGDIAQEIVANRSAGRKRRRRGRS